MKKAKREFPLKLTLLPGLGMTGSLTVIQRTEKGFIVGFDAEILDPRVLARYVYDRAELTPKQIKDWTGEDLGGEP